MFVWLQPWLLADGDSPGEQSCSGTEVHSACPPAAASSVTRCWSVWSLLARSCTMCTPTRSSESTTYALHHAPTARPPAPCACLNKPTSWHLPGTHPPTNCRANVRQLAHGRSVHGLPAEPDQDKAIPVPLPDVCWRVMSTITSHLGVCTFRPGLCVEALGPGP